MNDIQILTLFRYQEFHQLITITDVHKFLLISYIPVQCQNLFVKSLYTCAVLLEIYKYGWVSFDSLSTLLSDDVSIFFQSESLHMNEKVLCKQFVLKSEAVKNWRKKTRHSLFIDGNTYRSIFVHNYIWNTEKSAIERFREY